MSQTIVLNHDFYRVSLSLKEKTDQFEALLTEWRQISAEKFTLFKEEALASWTKWSEESAAYQALIEEMPKELKQRAIVQQTLKSMQAIQADLNVHLQNWKETSLPELQQNFDRKLQESREAFDRLQVNLQEISQQISELETHPLVQKCLRGERVLSSKKNIQWGRKIGHMAFGLFFLYVFALSGLSKAWMWGSVAIFSAMAFTLETWRHFNPRVNEWVIKAFRPVMRESEKTQINSSMFYIVSMVLVAAICPMPVTVVTMFFIAVGDPVAGIVGVKFGKTKLNNHASLEGVLACIGVCALLTFLSITVLLPHSNVPFHYSGSFLGLSIFSILAGMVAAFAESSFKRWDDNLVMPLLSAPIIWVLMSIFSII